MSGNKFWPLGVAAYLYEIYNKDRECFSGFAASKECLGLSYLLMVLSLPLVEDRKQTQSWNGEWVPSERSTWSLNTILSDKYAICQLLHVL